MHFDVRTAALSDLIEHHVRLAVSLLGAHHLQARLRAWDGTRCDLLIALADDAYGAQALALARRRGTAMIALGRINEAVGVPLVNPEASALALSQLILELLKGMAPNHAGKNSKVPQASIEQQQPDAGQQPDAVQQPVLCQLAVSPLRGKAVNILCGGHTLRLRPQLGRAYAATQADLLAATEKIPGTECCIVGVDGREPLENQVSASLESVLLRVAYRLGGQLPEFPDGRYRLDAWPDFGVLPSLVGVLRVTKLLTSNNTRSLSELRASEVDKATQIELNVCLWAFAAADLLRDAGAVQTTVAPLRRTPRVEEGLLSSLARRFGLWRGQ